MTTGNRVVDLRQYRPPTYWSGYHVGLYASKSWAGGDRAKAPNLTYIMFQRDSKRLVRKKLWARPPKAERKELDHPYNCSWSKFNNVEILAKSGNRWGKAGFKELFSSGNFPDRWNASDQYALLSKLRDAIGGSSLNAAVAVAEGSQSLALIADSARRIYTAYGAAQKGQFKQAHHLLTGGLQQKVKRPKKKWATNWLELQYGWLPLLSDVYAAAEFLAQQLNFPLQQTIRVRRGRKLGPPLDLSSSTLPLVTYGALQGQIIARIKEVNIPKLLGLADPLSVVWEKLPYSFVIDWFLPIGSWLSARGLAQSVTGTFVVTKKEFFGWRGAIYKPGGATQFTGANGWWFEQGTMSRTVSNVLPVPLPEFKPLAKVASWRHCANSVALLLGLADKTALRAI